MDNLDKKFDMGKATAWKPSPPSMEELADRSRSNWAYAKPNRIQALFNTGVIASIALSQMPLAEDDSHHGVQGHPFDGTHIGNLPDFNVGPVMSGAHIEPFSSSLQEPVLTSPVPPLELHDQEKTIRVRGFTPADGSTTGTYAIVTLHSDSEQPIDLAIFANSQPGDLSQGMLLKDVTLVGGSNNWKNVAPMREGEGVTRNSDGEIIRGGENGITGWSQHLDNNSTSWDSIARLLADGGVSQTDASLAALKKTFDLGEPLNIQLFNLGEDANGNTIFQTRVANGDGLGIRGPQLMVSGEFSQTAADFISGASQDGMDEQLFDNVSLKIRSAGENNGETTGPVPTATEAEPQAGDVEKVENWNGFSGTTEITVKEIIGDPYATSVEGLGELPFLGRSVVVTADWFGMEAGKYSTGKMKFIGAQVNEIKLPAEYDINKDGKADESRFALLTFAYKTADEKPVILRVHAGNLISWHSSWGKLQDFLDAYKPGDIVRDMSIDFQTPGSGVTRENVLTALRNKPASSPRLVDFEVETSFFGSSDSAIEEEELQTLLRGEKGVVVDLSQGAFVWGIDN